MARSARLLDLLQALRRRRRPVSAAALAKELGVSVRTIYRDIATLAAQGAPIDGEAGLGYVLRPGFLLPPLMFVQEEVEAMVLGLRLVVRQSDPSLAQAAVDAAAKINAVLPDALRESALSSSLYAGPAGSASTVGLEELRAAVRRERKLRLIYSDAEGRFSERVVWPFAFGFFDDARLLAAWCEARKDFRHFRIDRIVAAETLPERYPRRRTALMQQWREKEGIDPEF